VLADLSAILQQNTGFGIGAGFHLTIVGILASYLQQLAGHFLASFRLKRSSTDAFP
jgi:hypothetical protein